MQGYFGWSYDSKVKPRNKVNYFSKTSWIITDPLFLRWKIDLEKLLFTWINTVLKPKQKSIIIRLKKITKKHFRRSHNRGNWKVLCLTNKGITYKFWRCPWYKSYRRSKWTRQHEFKSRTRLIAFHIVLIPLGKVWIQLFSLQLWVNSRSD